MIERSFKCKLGGCFGWGVYLTEKVMLTKNTIIIYSKSE